jgi:hypothetical protein
MISARSIGISLLRRLVKLILDSPIGRDNGNATWIRMFGRVLLGITDVDYIILVLESRLLMAAAAIGFRRWFG